jgi:copper chaperone CopZ
MVPPLVPDHEDARDVRNVNTRAGVDALLRRRIRTQIEEREMRKPGSRSIAAVLAVIVGLALTPVNASAQSQQEAAPDNAPRQIQITVLGMSCPFCAYGVEKKLKNLDGVEDLEVVLETGIATITLEDGADVSNEELQKQVKEAGFEAAKIMRNFDSEYADFDAINES